MSRFSGFLLVLGVLAGCAALRGVETFEPGAVSIDQVRAKERPVTEWKNADGTLTLEYVMRSNDQNVMLDFDAKGGLVAVRRVSSEEYLERIRTAMTREQVRRILGTPRHVSKDPVTEGEVWEWPLDPEAAGMSQRQIMVLFHPVVDGVFRTGLSKRNM